mmetsp:Transcript_49301/g.157898  ORF Transcript_49301/g.157898 Transcript_49301/m.157898 type:complete len:230 (+) Transcript_49301:389-1078(+)
MGRGRTNSKSKSMNAMCGRGAVRSLSSPSMYRSSSARRWYISCPSFSGTATVYRTNFTQGPTASTIGICVLLSVSITACIEGCILRADSRHAMTCSWKPEEKGGRKATAYATNTMLPSTPSALTSLSPHDGLAVALVGLAAAALELTEAPFPPLLMSSVGPPTMPLWWDALGCTGCAAAGTTKRPTSERSTAAAIAPMVPPNKIFSWLLLPISSRRLVECWRNNVKCGI